MFGTLRLGSDNSAVKFTKHAGGEEASRLGGYVFSHSHSACDTCRSKKLRCSGHKSGCDRCKNRGLKCTYSSSTDGKRPRQKSQPQTEGGSPFSMAGFSASGSSNGSPGASSSGSRPRTSQGGRRKRSTTTTSSRTSSTTGHTPPLLQDTQLEDVDLSHDLNLDHLAYPIEALDGIFDSIAGSELDDAQMKDIVDLQANDYLNSPAFDMIAGSSHIPDSLGMADGMLHSNASESALSPFTQVSKPLMSRHPSHDPRQSVSSIAPDEMLSQSGRSRSRTDSLSCQCLPSILRVLDDITANILTANQTNVYALLSFQRKALVASNKVLTCQACGGRLEYITLLGIISEKITELSEATVAAFVRRVHDSGDAMDADLTDAASSRHEGKMRLGEFEIETPDEFKVLSATMIKMQLRNSLSFVRKTREIAASTDRTAQSQSLKKLETQLKELSTRMQKVASDVESDHE